MTCQKEAKNVLQSIYPTPTCIFSVIQEDCGVGQKYSRWGWEGERMEVGTRNEGEEVVVVKTRTKVFAIKQSHTSFYNGLELMVQKVETKVDRLEYNVIKCNKV